MGYYAKRTLVLQSEADWTPTTASPQQDQTPAPVPLLGPVEVRPLFLSADSS